MYTIKHEEIAEQRLKKLAAYIIAEVLSRSVMKGPILSDIVNCATKRQLPTIPQSKPNPRSISGGGGSIFSVELVGSWLLFLNVPFAWY